MSLTRGIDSDAARRALASALIQFAKENGSEVIAEGVETAAELKALRALGVMRAQGYFLGRPAPLATAAALCRRHAPRSPGRGSRPRSSQKTARVTGGCKPSHQSGRITIKGTAIR